MQKVCPKCNRSYPLDADYCADDQERLIVVRGDTMAEGMVIDDRYRILGIIGKGGMGAVYRAYQLLMDREVAFKILKSDLSDPSQVKRFFIEAKAASRLTHPNTITLFDFGQTREGMLYIAMELVRGRSLAQMLRDDGPMAPERVVHIVSQVCDSIAEAHSQGIVHRDLKPDNILIENKEWDADFVKVLDFGIAKLLGGSEGTAVTKTGIVCGTPQYMSPEAITGQQIGPGADLYALGIILYEMLAGEPPFQAETPMKLLLSHLNEEPRSLLLPEKGIEIPVQLDRFIMRALSKSPEARPATARQFKEELQACLREFKKRPSTTTLRAMSESQAGSRTLVEADEARTPVPGTSAVVRPQAPREPGRVGTTASGAAALSADDIEAMTGAAPRRGLLVGTAIFALVGLVVLGVVIVRARQPEPPASSTPITLSVPVAPAQAPAAEPADAGAGAVASAPDAGATEPDVPPPASAPLAARLESTPAGAAVFLGDQPVCTTPCDLRFEPDTRGQERTYRLTREGYRDVTLHLSVGAQDAWSATLEPLPLPPKPAPKKPVAKKPAPKKPVAKKPAPKKPVAKKPAPKVDIDIEPASF